MTRNSQSYSPLPFVASTEVPGLPAKQLTGELAQGATNPSSAATTRLLVTLSKALHRFGTPAHRLEAAMTAVSRRLNLEVHFFSTPTAIFIAHGPADQQRTFLVRVEPGEVHLEKLSEIDEILHQVVAGELEAGSAAELVEAVLEAPSRYGPVITTLAFTVASGAAARFFGGGLLEIAAACGVGLITGVLALIMGKHDSAQRLFDTVAAVTAATIATTLGASLGTTSAFIVTLAGLIALLPGLTLTVAMTELATRNLVSGSARLAGAGIVFLTLGFGAALGSHLGALFGGQASSRVPQGLAPWTEILALVIAAGAFVVLFKARSRDFGWVLAAGALAFYAGQGGTHLLGPELGASGGALVLGLGSNFIARVRQRPSAITQVPGLMLLVPGSLGFQGVSSLAAHDTLTGIEAAFSMILVAVGLVTGLLMANLLLPPRRSL